jgi:undecaprenyl-diphosphatase
MDSGHTLILGALQGISELFPISSLAQTILIPAILKWNMGGPDQPDFLAFVVALHLATAIALLIYFWKDWKLVFQAYIGSAKRRQLVYDQPSKFAWLLVAGTIITGLIGAVLEKHIRRLFDEPKYYWIVAAVLMFNGLIMIYADVLKRRVSVVEDPVKQEGPHTADPATDIPSERRHAEDLTFIEAAAVGATQSFALIPGISRSGVTIVAGLLAGLSYEEAGRFSFMLGTPIIGLAALKEVHKILAPDVRGNLPITLAAALLSGITAYLSTFFLMRYFRHNRLAPFGWYCIAFGLYALIVLKF